MLSDILSNMLDRPITEETAHSRTVCEQCLKLCTEFDVLFSRLDAIKTHVIECYNETIENHYCIDIIESDNDVDMHRLSGDPLREVVDHVTLESVKKGSDQQSPQNDHQEPTQNELKEFVEQSKKIIMLTKESSLRKNLMSTSSSDVTQIEDMPFQLIEDGEGDKTCYFFKIPEKKDGNSTNHKQEIIEEHEVEIRTENDDDRFDDFDVDDDVAMSEAVNHVFLPHTDNAEPFGVADDGTPYAETETKVTDSKTEVMISLDPAEPSTYGDVTIKPIFVRDGTIFKCQLCEEPAEETFDHRSIVDHMKSQHNERVFVCDLCGADYRQKRELTEHMEEHVNGAIDVNMECDVCQRVFSNLRLFRIHTKTHAVKSKNGPTQKSWACKFCSKKFNSRNLMEEHKNKHTGDRPYKCADCPKDFASKYTLTAHMKIHSDRKRPYACQTCPKTFYSHQNLAQHERTHTGVKEHVCGVCDKAFGTLHNLEVHKIVHTGFKPFICRTCGKAFARRAEIKDHERTHTGERPFVCDICGASFAQRSNLTSHKRATHLNDKRYKCEECGKTFKRRRLLDYHCKASHTGERPYTCQMCGSTFVYPEHYKKHLRIHTGVKPFQCEVCGKAFNSRDNRNAHRFVHSDKKPYECLFCGVGFMRKPQLLAHMKIFNHENKRIVLNQPRILADGEDTASGKSMIDSNVVFIEDIVDEDDDDEQEDFEIDSVCIISLSFLNCL